MDASGITRAPTSKDDERKHQPEPGSASLTYHPAKVSWSTSEFIRRPPAFLARLYLYVVGSFILAAALYAFYCDIAVSVEGAGALVAASAPGSSEFVADIAVSFHDVSQLAIGSPGLIRVDALPDRDFGSIAAKVSMLPGDVMKSAPHSPPGHTPAYHVQLKLEQQMIHHKGLDLPLMAGMAITGVVVVRRETLLIHLVKKLLMIRDQLVGN